MNMARGGALTALVLLVAIGCGGSDAAPPNQGGGGDGGTVVVALPDGGTAEVPAPPKAPPVGGEAEDGIYVSNTKGAPGTDGAKTRPLRTIAEGIALAKEKHLPVNVCAETYVEAVTLVDGVTMFGYFDCTYLDKWVRGSTHAKIVAPTSPAVIGENLVLPATFAGFDIDGPDIPGTAATGPAASSYGMVLRASQELTITEVTIRAGKGQDGVDGIEPAEGNSELSAGADGKLSSAPEAHFCTGNPAICNFSTIGTNTAPGALGGTSTCKRGPAGGPGGRGGSACIKDNNGLYRNCTFTDAAGKGGTTTTAAGGGFVNVGSSAGSNGDSGPDGTTGTHGTWSFTAAGFVPGDGTAGSDGQPGDGGGGGAGSLNFGFTVLLSGEKVYHTPPAGVWRTATGGGGGAGGCGGIAGTAGKGGGASVGLLVANSSKINIIDARIEGKKGGRAGKGATGTNGTPGRAGGGQGPENPNAGVGKGSGAPGGKGGNGGHAGLSGHGSAGPSFALVVNGGRPFTKNVTLVSGAPGDGYPQAQVGTQTLPALTGEAKEEHSF